VHAGEHPAQRPDAVRREQAEALVVAAGAEVREGLLERLALENAGLRVVEDAEARVDAGRERVRAQQAVADRAGLPRRAAPVSGRGALRRPAPCR
jgi:hypothetical protein